MTAAAQNWPLACVEIPVRTVSEANSHQHWRVRQRRAKTQRTTAKAVMAVTAGSMPSVAPLRGPLVVRLTRIAPSRGLDSDNLPPSMKHVRDGIADWLGIDDRDPRVTWTYAQERGSPKHYAVRVEIWGRDK